MNNGTSSVGFTPYASTTLRYLSVDQERRLMDTIPLVMMHGRGILSVDEPIGLLDKRFQTNDLENTEANRRLYRQLYFSRSSEFSKYVSCAILSHEGFYQNDDHDKLFRDLLREQGILSGIKVDKGLVPIAGTDGEMATQGLDGLAERCGQYYKDGARFTAWRCLFKLGKGLPSDIQIQETSNAVARYASISQQHGLVPILKLETMAEKDADLSTCQRAVEKIFGAIYKTLHDHGVILEGTLLNVEMIRSGADCSTTYPVEETVEATVTALRRTVPPAVPVICISIDEPSSMVFRTINQYSGREPWQWTFHCGRTLQLKILTMWNGRTENVSAAQRALLEHIEQVHDQRESLSSDTHWHVRSE